MHTIQTYFTGKLSKYILNKNRFYNKKNIWLLNIWISNCLNKLYYLNIITTPCICLKQTRTSKGPEIKTIGGL